MQGHYTDLRELQDALNTWDMDSLYGCTLENPNAATNYAGDPVRDLSGCYELDTIAPAGNAGVKTWAGIDRDPRTRSERRGNTYRWGVYSYLWYRYADPSSATYTPAIAAELNALARGKTLHEMDWQERHAFAVAFESVYCTWEADEKAAERRAARAAKRAERAEQQKAARAARKPAAAAVTVDAMSAADLKAIREQERRERAAAAADTSALWVNALH